MLIRTPFPHLLVTESDLRRWLADAANGESLAYYRGFLAIDRVTPGSRLPKHEAQELDRVANAAMTAAETGRAHLLQRRHGIGDYGYLIVRRHGA